MITLDPQVENELTALALEKGVTVSELIKQIILSYQEEKEIQEAEKALHESGGISLTALKTKYAL